MVCKDAATEPVLQDVEGKQLTRGSNKAQDARLDIHARGFSEPQRSAFLVRSPKDGELLGLEWGMILQVSNIIFPD